MFSLSGGYMEASPGLERNLRFMGAANRLHSLRCGTNHLLDMSENKQPDIQHHVVRRQGDRAHKRMAKWSAREQYV